MFIVENNKVEYTKLSLTEHSIAFNHAGKPGTASDYVFNNGVWLKCLNPANPNPDMDILNIQSGPQEKGPSLRFATFQANWFWNLNCTLNLNSHYQPNTLRKLDLVNKKIK